MSAFTDDDLKRWKAFSLQNSDGAYHIDMEGLQALLARLEVAENTITAERCPDCPDQGWYAFQQPSTGEVEQEQCEFCCSVKNSRFHALEAWCKVTGK